MAEVTNLNAGAVMRVKLEAYVPLSHLEQASEALRRAGAGVIGCYDSVLSYSKVRGRWRAVAGANPHEGEIGQLCEMDEYKIEAVCSMDKLEAALKELRLAHPYEEPLINVVPLIGQ